MGVEGTLSEDEAFSSFVLARQARLVQFGWALTGDRQLGEDLAQGALERLWPHWSRVSGAGDPLPYTQRIMVNLATSRRRGRRWQAERLDASVPDLGGADEAAGVDAQDALDRWLRLLPTRQRAVIVLRFVCDLSVEQTAGVLRCSSGTVKSQTAKALSSLRRAEPVLNSEIEESSS